MFPIVQLYHGRSSSLISKKRFTPPTPTLEKNGGQRWESLGFPSFQLVLFIYDTAFHVAGKQASPVTVTFLTSLQRLPLRQNGLCVTRQKIQF